VGDLRRVRRPLGTQALEYWLAVPANRLGYTHYSGFQLKSISNPRGRTIADSLDKRGGAHRCFFRDARSTATVSREFPMSVTLPVIALSAIPGQYPNEPLTGNGARSEGSPGLFLAREFA